MYHPLELLIRESDHPAFLPLKILDGASPSEWRREFARRYRRRRKGLDAWYPASITAAYYVEAIDKSANKMDRIDALANAANVSRSTANKYRGVGTAIIRRILAIDERPVPSETYDEPLSMEVIHECLGLARRLKIDVLDVMCAIEREYPRPSPAELAGRTTLRVDWKRNRDVIPIDEMVATYQDELEKSASLPTWDNLPPFEWAFVSTDGYYRAAQGKSEAVVGMHWDDVMVDRPVLIDGEKMMCRDAWTEMNAHGDNLGVPMIIIWPDIDGQFEHRPDAAGVMELLVIRVRVREKLAGFLFVDFGDSKYLSEVALNSYGRLRRALQPIVERIEEQVEGIKRPAALEVVGQNQRRKSG